MRKQIGVFWYVKWLDSYYRGPLESVRITGKHWDRRFFAKPMGFYEQAKTMKARAQKQGFQKAKIVCVHVYKVKHSR